MMTKNPLGLNSIWSGNQMRVYLLFNLSIKYQINLWLTALSQ